MAEQLNEGDPCAQGLPAIPVLLLIVFLKKMQTQHAYGTKRTAGGLALARKACLRGNLGADVEHLGEGKAVEARAGRTGVGAHVEEVEPVADLELGHVDVLADLKARTRAIVR